MSPLVFNTSARPGQEVPFEITIDAYRQDIDLRVEPSGILQQPTGLILPDESAAPMGVVRLHGTSAVRLRQGEKRVLRGTWRIPVDASGFLATGLLVTEQQKPQPLPSIGEGQQAASVQFITRYLLRLEAMVSSPRQGDMVPTIHSARLVERHGRAWVTAQLQAPVTGTGNLRLQAWAQLSNAEGRPVTKEFALHLPVRDTQPLPMRDQIPLLAGSRVAIHAEVPEPLFPGQYQLTVSAGDSARRHQDQVTEPIEVRPGDFPAQQTVVAQVIRDVEVSPSQLELSVARGGSRLLPLTLRNRAAHAIQVELAPKAVDGTVIDWLVIRPAKFSLPAGRERKVLVAVRGGTPSSKNQYGHLRVEVTSTETTSVGTHALPVALLCAGGAEVPAWKMAQACWSGTTVGGAFELSLENTGGKHLAPHASLRVTDELGRQINSEAGFERWILPGETSQLRFPTPKLPEGKYQLEVEVTPTPGGTPVRDEQTVEIAGGASPQLQ